MLKPLPPSSLRALSYSPTAASLVLSTPLGAAFRPPVSFRLPPSPLTVPIGAAAFRPLTQAALYSIGAGLAALARSIHAAALLSASHPPPSNPRAVGLALAKLNKTEQEKK